jgi:hypothetical protein
MQPGRVRAGQRFGGRHASSLARSMPVRTGCRVDLARATARSATEVQGGDAVGQT